MLRQPLLIVLLSLFSAVIPLAFAQTDENFDRCIEAILKADVNGNGRLNKYPEYVMFLELLAGDEFTLTTYDELPEGLILNYEIYESEGVIDIRGATLGANATSREKRLTETLCETTYLAIEAVPEDNPSRTSTNMNVTGSNATNASTNSTMDSVIVAAASIDESMRVNVTDEEISDTTLLEPSTPSGSGPATSGPISRNTTAPSPSLATQAPITKEANTTSSPIENITVASQLHAATASPSDALNTAIPSANLNETDLTETLFVNGTITDPTVAISNGTDTVPTVTNFPTVAPVADPVPTMAVPSVPTMAVPSVPTMAVPSVDSSNVTNEVPTLGAKQTPNPSAAQTEDDPFSTCKTIMLYSDINADGAMNKIEYVWFLNDNWNSPYPGIEFQNLPQEIKDNFFKFTSDDELTISIVASPEETTRERGQFLDQVCNETDIALSQVPASDNAGEEAKMGTFEECLESVVQFDTNSDAFLDGAEYVALINELSSGEFGQDTLLNLPDALLLSFQSLSKNAMIDLGGEKEGEMLGSSQQEVLGAICDDTSYALHEALRSRGEVDLFDAVDTDTMLEYAACFLQMADYDQDQDSRLDEEEYVSLVNQLGKNRFQGLNFTQLPLSLTINFFKLETDGAIDIEGAQEQSTPSTEQQHHLGKVCIETTAAVNMEIEFENPFAVDMGEPLVVHSSFNIYSDVIIPDHEFLMGATRELLQNAYLQFVMEVVDGLSQDGSATRRLLARRLQDDNEFLAILDQESPTVYHVIDLDCAGASIDAMCKTVFAQYEITPIASMDRDALYEEYVRVTQAFIDSGLFQEILERVDPETLIAVIGASEPVIYEDVMEAGALEPVIYEDVMEAEQGAPMDLVPFYGGTDDDYEEEMANSKKKVVALIAVAVSCILIASLAGLVAVKLRKRSIEDDAAAGILEGNDDRAADKASDTASKEEEFQEEGSSQGSRASRDLGDEELGKMSVIDLCEGVNAAANDFEAIGNKHLMNSTDSESNGGLPPLRKKKNGEIASADSGDLSFEFRRYAINGDENQACI